MSEETNLIHQPLGLAERCTELYGGSPHFVRAPGRVNLIGEHTDYNDGFVFPAAIGFETRIAIAARASRRLILHSENYGEAAEYDLDNLPDVRRRHWSDYPVAVVRELEGKLGQLPGANLLLSGDVPQGAGLSSSASLEVAVCLAFMELPMQRMDGRSIALLCQKAENEFVGARCGIMDQFISVHGQKDCALRLDCRSLDYQLLPIPPAIRLVICNTMIRHCAGDGEYNQRRAECETATRYFAARLPSVRALRDVTLEDLENIGAGWQEVIRKRCRHVITENLRVLQAADASARNDLDRLGELTLSSYTSLRDDFSLSCRELDLMVRLAMDCEGVYGARMTGGGFGGCTINLVRADSVEEFRIRVDQGYERATRLSPEIYITSAADGAGKPLQNRSAAKP
jgi:galactokinase